MTHVELQPDLLPLLGRTDNVLDGIAGFVEHYDFSRANSSYEARVQAITKVASICYQNPKAIGSESLYNRLMAESHGLPSSSFEFVPMLLSEEDYWGFVETQLPEGFAENNPLTKFGEWIEDDGKKYLLTNFRAVVYLFEKFGIDSRDHFNTEAECAIIAKHFSVFKYYVDLPTRAQMVRHRVSWQELSRRYVSGKKSPFDFYISKKMDGVVSGLLDAAEYDEFNTSMLIDACVNHYNKAIDAGIKPEEARRILPQAMMTQIWGAFQPSQLDNWFTLRLDQHAQLEIRCVAEAMKELIDGN